MGSVVGKKRQGFGKKCVARRCGEVFGEVAVKPIALRKELARAEIKSPQCAHRRSARSGRPYRVPARHRKAEKERGADLEREPELTVETIQARAETVTAVLENILQLQPILPLALR